MAARPASKPATRPGPPRLLLYLVAWLMPGLGHLWLGRRQKGLVLAVVLPAMFVLGLVLHGRLFPLVLSEPLVALASLANVASGLPFLVAKAMGVGGGQPASVTYEYANAFLITSGLLNALVVMDAHDIAVGRK